MMLLLVGLAVLLVLGGGGLIYYTTVFYPAQVQAQATMTAQNLLTMQAVNATGTALGNTHATATAQTAATAQAIATATALPAIYMQATSGNPVINDSLAGNSSSNWSEGRFTNGSSCSFAGGALHASAATNSGVLCLALNTNFTDFAYQVQMTILKGNSGGLIFRTQTTSGSFYAFQIIPSGQYDLSLIQNAGQNNISVKTLTTGTSPAIKTGQNQPNLVAVVARGSNIYLYVNQQYVASVDDNTISSGKIGVVGGSSTTAPGDVTFNNAKVWNA